MRALLLLNPRATRVSERTRSVIAGALAAELKLDVAETTGRGHATHLARQAASEGFDLVACLSGDGTLNEVVGGLFRTPVALAPLPGGGTNVFSRAMGLPRDPVEATGVLLERLRAGAAPRVINLGVVNGRPFLASAGVGFDGAVVRAVERRLRLRKRLGDWLYISAALDEFFLRYPRRDAPLTLRHADGDTEGLRLAIACNLDPYTFLGTRPLRVCPLADIDGGLDVMALRSLRTLTVLRAARGILGRGTHMKMRATIGLHNAEEFEVLSSRPIPYQVDGDYLGTASAFRFKLAPRALRVVV